MGITSTSIAFGIVVVALVVYINRRPANADDQWKRQEERLRSQGITAQCPEDWEAQVNKQRSRYIYTILAMVILIAVWFGWSIYQYR